METQKSNQFPHHAPPDAGFRQKVENDMKQTTRLTILFVCAFLLFQTMFLPGSWAEELSAAQSGDFSYALDAFGAAAITEYTGAAERVTIPETLDGHRVTAVGEGAFSQNETIISVTLPQGLESIGNDAFYGCYSLASLTLPERLESIGNYAFALCESLASLSLPDSLDTVGHNPFLQTPVDLSLSPGHPQFALISGMLFDKAEKSLISYPYHSTEEEYTVPGDVQAIGDAAFAACASLTSVTLPDGLLGIGKNAFSQCESLASINLPAGLKSIGDGTFSYCESLVSVTFPEGLTDIGDYAFDYCSSLLSVKLPEGLTDIGSWAFGNCGLRSAVLPANVTRIGEYAFEGCPDLILHVTQGSFAQLWARKNGIPAQFTDTGSSDEAAPKIPDGTLAPLDISLPSGKKFPVYTGPGEEYARAGNDKANVSTNGWVQVFGRENGWLLIQYGIKEGQMRFGYISAKGLQLENSAADLPSLWEDGPLSLKEPALLTDDPLASGTDIARLPAGLEVRRLGWMGPWAYVEARDGERLLRGFVRGEFLDSAPSPGGNLPFDLRAVSWGPLEPDFALRRYYDDETIGRLPETGGPAPNVWLRLDSLESRAALETLTNFRVTAGRAACGGSLVPLYAYDSRAEEGLTLHFMPRDGFNRGALEITLEEGESLGNVVIACTRALPEGREETLILPLAGVQEDSGYPSGGAEFTALRFTPFTRTPEQMAEYQAWSGKPALLGGVLEDMAQAMPGAPEEVLGLPYDLPEYRLYLLEGQIQKEHGPFGVHDVTFSLDNPPEGVWLAAYQQCSDCSEIDAFDMFPSDILLPDGLQGLQPSEDTFIRETLQRDFALLLLVSLQGRDETQINSLVRGLQVNAAFSAEKWNVRYEQHLETTAIGPRSRERVDLSGITTGGGPLTEIP